jgi:hypothetical protein
MATFLFYRVLPLTAYRSLLTVDSTYSFNDLPGMFILEYYFLRPVVGHFFFH